MIRCHIMCFLVGSGQISGHCTSCVKIRTNKNRRTISKVFIWFTRCCAVDQKSMSLREPRLSVFQDVFVQFVPLKRAQLASSCLFERFLHHQHHRFSGGGAANKSTWKDQLKVSTFKIWLRVSFFTEPAWTNVAPLMPETSSNSASLTPLHFEGSDNRFSKLRALREEVLLQFSQIKVGLATALSSFRSPIYLTGTHWMSHMPFWSV